MRSSFEDQVQRFVGAVDGVASVQLHFDVMSADEKAALSSRLRGGRPEKTISLEPATRVSRDRVGQGRRRQVDPDGEPRGGARRPR